MEISVKLIRQCIHGEEQAQYEMYRACFPILMSICVRYHSQRCDAEASLNIGFYKVITNLENYDHQKPFIAWIKRIMINTLIDEYRKNKTRIEESTDFDEISANGFMVDYNEAAQRLDAEELEQMIHKLPDMSGKVFNLYAIDGYMHREVSELLGISIGTSKWHLSNARKRLQLMVAKKMGEHKKEKGSQKIAY